MSKRSFMLEVTECDECPYWDHFSEICDYEGDEMEVKLASDGGLPSNCPIWLERMENVNPNLAIYPKTLEESFRPKEGGALRWEK